MGFTIDFSVLNQKGTPALYSDIFANRPAAGYQGRLFIATDTAAIYEDTGTAWTLIANVSSGAGTLQQVTTNGNTSNVGISVTAGGVSTNSATITTLTTGSVPFAGAGGLISQDNANLFWDDTNNRLGINTNTPGNSLDVHSAGTNPILALNNTAGNQSAVSFLNTSVAKWRIGNTATNTLDIYNFTLAAIALQIKANNEAVFISSVQADDFVVQPTGYSILAALSRNLTGAGYGVLSLRNSAVGTIQPSTLSVDRTYTLPDATGTLALTSNLSAYLPLAGGTMTGTLNGTSGLFSSNVNVNGLATSANYKLGVTGAAFIGGTNNKGLFITDGASYASIVGLNSAISAYNSVELRASGTDGQLFLHSSGRVSINSTTDDTVNQLQVTGNSYFSGNIGSGQSASNTYQGITVYGSNPSLKLKGSGASSWTWIEFATSSNVNNFSMGVNQNIPQFVIKAGAGLDTPSFILSSSGVVTITNLAGTGSRAVLADANGVLSAPVSDQSVKENIEPLKYGLDTIMKLNAVQFEFIEGYKNYGEGLQIGAIAQEVEQIIPEAVFKTPLTELKGIDYTQFHGIYIKAIQEQQKIIESLIQRIELLENK